MIGSFRNFAKTKFAGILVFIMIIPFVFWGMGSMFSSGNTNNLAKINKTNISTKEFIDYLNKSGIPQDYIRENLDNNIIQELLAGLISSSLLDLEIKDLDIIISEETLLKKIRTNKNFLDENGSFQRVKYEKFLLENSRTAASFELELRKRELQKNLFDYVGAGVVTPTFLAKKLYEEENKKLEIEFIDLNNFYLKENEISQNDLVKFIDENKDKLKIEYLDFNYAKISPKELTGIDEFNQAFFDKIDQIEIDISNEISFDTIINDLNIRPITINDFRFSINKNKIEKKIFELRNNKMDIFENDDGFVLYEIKNIEERIPDLNDNQTKKEIANLIIQKNKFEYNEKLLNKIREKKFDLSDFNKMGQKSINSIKLNSSKDNKKFEINAVELLYSLPINSFTLINDDKDNIYLARLKKYENKEPDIGDENFKKFVNKQNSNSKKSILKSYDILLSEKYEIVLNQKTIERIRNIFQ